MRIRRLKLSGFKSFVEPSELRIEPGLTGVVGPNGCGKSNLLEAIRWVMGENSPKSMRSGGMDDVIFAGTASRPPRDFAEVVLTGEGDEGEPLEVVRRIEAKGYTLAAVELRTATPEILAAHYAEHEGKPFYGPLVEFMLSGPVLAVVIEGERCIEGFRSLAGATDPTVAATITSVRSMRPREAR